MKSRIRVPAQAENRLQSLIPYAPRGLSLRVLMDQACCSQLGLRLSQDPGWRIKKGLDLALSPNPCPSLFSKSVVDPKRRKGGLNDFR